jgi:hypothetical protein
MRINNTTGSLYKNTTGTIHINDTRSVHSIIATHAGPNSTLPSSVDIVKPNLSNVSYSTKISEIAHWWQYSIGNPSVP